MTPEELLKPRYKVIADYPDCPFGENQIIPLKYSEREKSWYYEWAEYDGIRREYESFFNKYPHLFRKLQWWEEREESEMPDYVKVNYKELGAVQLGEVVYKCYGWDMKSKSAYVEADYSSVVGCGTGVYPATESDHLMSKEGEEKK